MNITIKVGDTFAITPTLDTRMDEVGVPERWENLDTARRSVQGGEGGGA